MGNFSINIKNETQVLYIVFKTIRKVNKIVLELFGKRRRRPSAQNVRLMQKKVAVY